MAPRKKNLKLPMIPLRGLVIYPHMVLHFDVGRPMSVAALEAAMMKDQKLFLLTQRDADVEEPEMDDLYTVGIIASVKQVMNLPGDNLRLLVEGETRAVIKSMRDTDDGYVMASVTIEPEATDEENDNELQALLRSVRGYFQEFADASQRVTEATVQSVLDVSGASQTADLIAANILVKIDERQKMLETLPLKNRLENLAGILLREIELSGVEKEIQARVRQQLDGNQKDYYLREQIKAIQTELGDNDGDDADTLRARLEKTPLNDEARQKCAKEIERLSRMAPGTPEIAMSRTYIDWILDLPWGKTTQDDLNLERARKVLAKGHYGLEKVKERIIEYLAVLHMKKDMRGPILCFVGPPGVGKTSIVRAISEAVGRKFVQMSLGGVRDEAEIRGHRRTYIGSIPGRIISGLKQAGTMNPVFLFDEIDKLGNDYRGDPASALLEVLDSEQNNAFRDHYLELPFDLSKVMFITTANTADTIPPALLDRMELIEVPSYTEEEKLQIARKHLLPKQLEAHGLDKKAVKITDKVLKTLIEDYTREAGVRTLERTVGKVIRKAAVTMIETDVKTVNVTGNCLRKYLGAARYFRDSIGKEPRIGIVNGLAYTTVGGEILEVECAVMPGKGGLRMTGLLGDVMKESAEAAFSWVRAHHEQLGLKPDFYTDKDIHLHFPEGAVPKDGPSAGVTLITALVSVFTNRPVRADVAMTGELTLRGRVLPIGGLKEKTLAAYRAGIRTLIIPADNMKDTEDIPAYVLEQFNIVPADRIETVLETALVKND